MKMHSNSYMPEQPFMESYCKHIVSQSDSGTGMLAMYYSFTVGPYNDLVVQSVPSGVVDIIFRCNECDPVAHVYGLVLKGTECMFEKDSTYFGVRFQPGAAKPFLNTPLDRITEQKILLGEVLEDSQNIIRNISKAASFEERIGLFESFLAESLQPRKSKVPFLVFDIIRMINESHGELKVQHMADELGYSSRHLNNIFKKHVGVSPKFYSRVVRFQRCLEFMRSADNRDYTELAYDAGYYDQAHFINEFKAFTATTPSQFQYA